MDFPQCFDAVPVKGIGLEPILSRALSKGWYPTVDAVQLYASAYEEGFRDGERVQDGGDRFRRLGPFMVPYPFGM